MQLTWRDTRRAILRLLLVAPVLGFASALWVVAPAWPDEPGFLVSPFMGELALLMGLLATLTLPLSFLELGSTRLERGRWVVLLIACGFALVWPDLARLQHAYLIGGAEEVQRALGRELLISQRLLFVLAVCSPYVLTLVVRLWRVRLGLQIACLLLGSAALVVLSILLRTVFVDSLLSFYPSDLTAGGIALTSALLLPLAYAAVDRVEWILFPSKPLRVQPEPALARGAR